MILHRLLLENFRGVLREEVVFDERGVLVVEGPNESGKTSLVDALDMLLDHKATSQRGDVKAAGPVGRQVPVVVEAEFTVDGERMVYRKQFLSDKLTSLGFPGTARQTLTGDDAHEYVRALLDDKVDRSLWRALNIVQGQPLTQVGEHAAGMDAVRRALDAAAGGDAPTGDDALIRRAEEERDRYFTARRNAPKGELAESDERVRVARERLDEARARLAELDAAVARHEAATADLAGREAAVGDVRATVEQLAAAEERLGVLRAAVREGALALERAVSEETAARSALSGRERLVSELAEATGRAASLGVEAQEAAERAGQAAARVAEAGEAVAAAETAAGAARELVRRARRLSEARRRAVELEGVERTLASLADIDTELTGVREELEATEVDAGLLTELRAAVEEMRDAAARRAAQSPAVEVAGSGSVFVDGLEVDAATGWRGEVVESTRFEVGEVTLRVHPAGGTAAVRREYEAAEQRHAALLERAGVADVEEAEERSRRAAVLSTELESLRRRRVDLLGGDTREELERRAEELRSSRPGGDAEGSGTEGSDADGDGAEGVADGDGSDGDGVVDEETAERSARRAEDELAAARVAEREAVAAERESGHAHVRLVERSESATHRVAVLEQQLAASREEHTDEALREAVAAAERETARARVAAEQASASLDEALAEAPPGDLENARAALSALESEISRARDAVADAKGEATAIGGQGRLDEVAEAERELDAAEKQNAALWRRARAARLLAEVLTRRRSEALAAYQEPFHRAVVELGRLVYRRDFDVELSEDLTIVSRREGGVTVPYESLSGGAREQLAVIVRIACARLVGDDGVPLFLDDTMGYSDPGRRLAMGGVLAAAAGTSQLVVLTCDRARFAGVGGARTHTMGRGGEQAST